MLWCGRDARISIGGQGHGRRVPPIFGLVVSRTDDVVTLQPWGTSVYVTLTHARISNIASTVDITPARASAIRARQIARFGGGRRIYKSRREYDAEKLRDEIAVWGTELLAKDFDE